MAGPMLIEVAILTMVTAVVAVIALVQPWRERDWALGALAMGVLVPGFVIAVLLTLQYEVPSPLVLVRGLTQAILTLFR